MDVTLVQIKPNDSLVIYDSQAQGVIFNSSISESMQVNSTG